MAFRRFNRDQAYDHLRARIITGVGQTPDLADLARVIVPKLSLEQRLVLLGEVGRSGIAFAIDLHVGADEPAAVLYLRTD